MLLIPTPKGPWFEGRQIEQVYADVLADGNKVGEFCLE
jgi:hypothetical protein